MGARWAIVAALAVGCASGPGTRRPNHPQIQLADEAFERHQYKRAARHYRRILGTGNYRFEERYYVKHASALFLSRQYEECVTTVSDVGLVAHEDSPELRELRALCLWCQDRRDEAVVDANVAADIDRTRYRAQLLLGNYYFETDPGKAAVAFEAYLESRPRALAAQDAFPLIKLGTIYIRAGHGHGAQFVYRRVLERFSDCPPAVRSANNGLCAAYTLNGKYDLAMATCEEVVANPQNVDRAGSAWFNLASAAYQAGHYDRALTAVDEFIRLQPDKPNGPTLRKKIVDAVNARPATPQKGARPSQKGGRP